MKVTRSPWVASLLLSEAAAAAAHENGQATPFDFGSALRDSLGEETATQESEPEAEESPEPTDAIIFPEPPPRAPSPPVTVTPIGVEGVDLAELPTEETPGATPPTGTSDALPTIAPAEVAAAQAAPTVATPSSSTTSSSSPVAPRDRLAPVREIVQTAIEAPKAATTVDVEVEGLGRVEVRVEPVGDDVRVAVRAEDPATAAAIERQRGELLDLLRDVSESRRFELDTETPSDRGAHNPHLAPPQTREEDPAVASPTPRRLPRTPGSTTRRGLVDDLA